MDYSCNRLKCVQVAIKHLNGFQGDVKAIIPTSPLLELRSHFYGRKSLIYIESVVQFHNSLFLYRMEPWNCISTGKPAKETIGVEH